MIPEEAMAYARERLAEAGFQTTVISVAQTGSCYVAFDDLRMGKIRFGDHNERERYGYRWQIRTDLRLPKENTAKGHKRFFYPSDKLGILAFVTHARRYHAAILRTAAA